MCTICYQSARYTLQSSVYHLLPLCQVYTAVWCAPSAAIMTGIHGLSGKFQNVQNSPPLRRPSGARQGLVSSNEFDELRRENRIVLS